MFQAMSRDHSAEKKRGRLQVFLDRTYVASSRDDYFKTLHLVLPGLDRERGSYELKEVDLISALGIAKDYPVALWLTNWSRSGGSCNAKNFAFIMAKVLQRRQGMTSVRLMIKEANDPLDRINAT